jgi:hypothetical protein
MIEIGRASQGLNMTVSTENMRNIHPNSILRIEEKIHHLWNGVSKCCEQPRIDTETNDRFEVWLNEKKSKYSHLKVLRYGWVPLPVKCRHSEGGLWGPDNCTGSTIMPCFIEFLLPTPQPEPPIQFHIPYIAIRHTKWISHPAERDPETGEIKKGEIVFLSDDFSGGQYQQVKFRNGSIQFVDLSDFKKY